MKWFSELEKYGRSIAENTYMVYELFCTVRYPHDMRTGDLAHDSKI